MYWFKDNSQKNAHGNMSQIPQKTHRVLRHSHLGEVEPTMDTEVKTPQDQVCGAAFAAHWGTLHRQSALQAMPDIVPLKVSGPRGKVPIPSMYLQSSRFSWSI